MKLILAMCLSLVLVVFFMASAASGAPSKKRVIKVAWVVKKKTGPTQRVARKGDVFTWAGPLHKPVPLGAKKGPIVGSLTIRQVFKTKNLIVSTTTATFAGGTIISRGAYNLLTKKTTGSPIKGTGFFNGVKGSVSGSRGLTSATFDTHPENFVYNLKLPG